MKVTIEEFEDVDTSLWEGEALTATWDGEKGELVIRGDAQSRALTRVLSSMVDKRKLAIEIEDTGPGRLIWRGYLGSAEFLSFEAEQVECCLIMMLDDWFGILPLFSKS
jgi:hypothetical protein